MRTSEVLVQTVSQQLPSPGAPNAGTQLLFTPKNQSNDTPFIS